MNCLLLIVLGIYLGNLFIITYLSTHTVYQYKILLFFPYGGGGGGGGEYGHNGKWIQEKKLF